MILCKHCKYRYTNIYAITGDECYSRPDIGFNPIEEFKVFDTCLHKNKNNNCREYVPTLWARIFHRMAVRKCLDTLEHLERKRKNG